MEENTPNTPTLAQRALLALISLCTLMLASVVTMLYSSYAALPIRIALMVGLGIFATIVIVVNVLYNEKRR